MTLSDLPAVLAKHGLTRAMEVHPRILLARDMLEKEAPGLHDSLLFSGDVVKCAKLIDFYAKRELDIIREEVDPLRWGWRAPGGEMALAQIERIKSTDDLTIPKILCLGGNRASKTEFAAWFIMDLMVRKPGAQVAILCPSESQAIDVAMKRIWKYFPPEWKNEATGKGKKQGVSGSYTYTEKGGFTEGRFSLPNGSGCIFKYYMDGNVRNWEGPEYDAVWADEEVTQDWIDTAVYRLLSRRGTLLVTFTPIEGFTPVVAWFMEGAAVMKTRAAELLDGDVLPFLHESKDKAVIYFWTEDTRYPLNQYQILKQELVGGDKKKTKNEIKVRAYGIPLKVHNARFPIFDAARHIFEPSDSWMARLQEDFKGDHAPMWYLIIDPCNGRNFAMAWIMVRPDDRAIFWREWPQKDDYIPMVGNPGDWAIPSKDGKLKDGQMGPAQQCWNFTIAEMQGEMERIEAEMAVECLGIREAVIIPFRQLMDSRFGNNATLGEAANDSLIDRFNKTRDDGRPGRRILQASGKDLNPRAGRSEDGVHLIADWLGGFNASKPHELDTNQPRLMFHKRCTNAIFAVQNWTGADGPKGACKDWIDLLHYFVRDEPRWRPDFRKQPEKNDEWGGY